MTLVRRKARTAPRFRILDVIANVLEMRVHGLLLEPELLLRSLELTHRVV